VALHTGICVGALNVQPVLEFVIVPTLSPCEFAESYFATAGVEFVVWDDDTNKSLQLWCPQKKRSNQWGTSVAEGVKLMRQVCAAKNERVGQNVILLVMWVRVLRREKVRNYVTQWQCMFVSGKYTYVHKYTCNFWTLCIHAGMNLHVYMRRNEYIN